VGLVPHQREKEHKAALKNPKAFLWRTGLLIVAVLAEQGEGAIYKKRAEVAREELLPIAAKLAAYALFAEPGTFTLRSGDADLKNLILPTPTVKSAEP